MAIRTVFKSGAVSKAVIIPSHICESLGINENDRLDIVLKGNKIVITLKGD